MLVSLDHLFRASSSIRNSKASISGSSISNLREELEPDCDKRKKKYLFMVNTNQNMTNT